MLKDSIYKETYRRKDRRLNLGFDYKDQILRKSLSSQMFNVNSTLDKFLKDINDIIYNWIESVKMIKTHCNPHVDKYENRLN
jgi:hypothetical protein